MKAKLKVIKNWEFEEFELTGTSFKYSPTGCKGMVARSEDEIVFWTYHLVQKCSGVLWVCLLYTSPIPRHLLCGTSLDSRAG